MSTSPTSRPVVTGVTSGLLTAAWYAMADVVPSRGARAALKVGLAGATVGSALLVRRSDASDAASGQGDDGARPAGGSGAGEGPADRSPDGLAAVRALTGQPPVLTADDLGLDEHVGRAPRAVAVVGLGIAASLGVTVLVEWGIHRFGEHLAQRGVRAPHTCIGLTIGLVTGALAGASEARELRRR